MELFADDKFIVAQVVVYIFGRYKNIDWKLNN